MTHQERLRAEAKAQFLGNQHFVVTPSDETTFEPSAILNLDADKNIAIADTAGNVLVYTAVPAYFVIPVLATKVRQTATTSTSMVRIS